MAKKALALVLGLLFLFVGFVVAMRFVPPTPEQAAALQLLRIETPPVEGRDGSDAAWLLDRDVPAKKRADVARQYREYLDKAYAVGANRTAFANPLDAWKKFPEAPAEEEGVCKLRERGCLAYVKANIDLVGETLDTHRKGIDAALELVEHDGLRHGVRPSSSQPIPPLQAQRRLVKTWFAHEFATGHQLEAIDGVCRDITGWRRLGGNSDTLIASMVGVSYVEQDLVLLSELLEELSISASLPQSCEGALAEVAAYELDLCPAMRTEFRAMETIEQEVEAAPGGSESAQPFDGENFLASFAPGYARFCAGDRLQAARADRAAPPNPRPAKICTTLRRAADPFGCTLAEIAWPGNFERYLDRRTDQAAMLALMRTVVWLRTAVETTDEVEAALARRPASLGLRREPKFDAGASRVGIPLLDHSRGERFELIVRVGRPPKKRRSPVRAISGNRFALVDATIR